MITLTLLIAFCAFCIGFTEFMVQGVKEWLPKKLTDKLENVWSFAFSILSLFLPKMVKVPVELIPADFIPAWNLLTGLHWTFCLFLGILISRGGAVFYKFLKDRGISTPATDPGVVSKALYGTGDGKEEVKPTA